jgi:hypothetical protein
MSERERHERNIAETGPLQTELVRLDSVPQPNTTITSSALFVRLA